ncbi:MAG: radical SAM protein [Deltaproteobacteria bacterium]|nr:radical SAM protein [Deltaproteobacteria bacterium]
MECFTNYTDEHRRELERLLDTPQWREALDSGLVEEVKAERITPGSTRDYINTIVDQLLEFNEKKVEKLIRRNPEDEEYLFRELSRWPENLEGKDPTLSFVGLNLTAACNFEPKCIYCNQPYTKPLVDLDGWKKIIAEITTRDGEEGTYIYITGGEPLLLQEEIWGDEGLVRFATERGAVVNVNTNASFLTPEAALRLIKAGLSKLHISLDTADRDLQNQLFGGDRFDQVMEGIYNVQIARDLVGAAYPIMHTNCVLTNKNLDLVPQLLRFIFEKCKQAVSLRDPFYNDMFPHIVPVGGGNNDHLRPTSEEFRRFYEEVWPKMSKLWDDFQAGHGVPKDKRGTLFGYFSNPYLRVKHKGGLEDYVKISAEGRYGQLALCEYCYVAPTQASFSPDGAQYRCGSHAIRRILSTGNFHNGGVFHNIRQGMKEHGHLPQVEDCYGCALATLYINQDVESKLKKKLKSMLE